MNEPCAHPATEITLLPGLVPCVEITYCAQCGTEISRTEFVDVTNLYGAVIGWKRKQERIDPQP